MYDPCYYYGLVFDSTGPKKKRGYKVDLISVQLKLLHIIRIFTYKTAP